MVTKLYYLPLLMLIPVLMNASNSKDSQESSKPLINLTVSTRTDKRITQETENLVLEESPIISKENSANLKEILLLLEKLDDRNRRDREEIDEFMFRLIGEESKNKIVATEEQSNEKIETMLQELMEFMRLENELERERLTNLFEKVGENSESDDFAVFIEDAFSDSRDLDFFR